MGFCKEEGTYHYTADQDFLRMAAIDNDHAGIIYWTKSADGHFGPLVKQIDELCFNLSAADFLGLIYFL